MYGSEIRGAPAHPDDTENMMAQPRSDACGQFSVIGYSSRRSLLAPLL
jgi:hypothetical protein